MINKTLTKKTIQKRILKIVRDSWDNDVCAVHTMSFFAQRFVQSIHYSLLGKQKMRGYFSVGVFVLTFGYMVHPLMVQADVFLSPANHQQETIAMIIDSMQNESVPYGTLPVSENASPRRFYTLPITAYTSEAAQTDDTPCITASGMDVCARNQEDIIAANFLPIGTRVRIPELFGDRIFTVQDRMNKRYDKRVDVWFKDLNEARKFGLKHTTIEVF